MEPDDLARLMQQAVASALQQHEAKTTAAASAAATSSPEAAAATPVVVKQDFSEMIAAKCLSKNGVCAFVEVQFEFFSNGHDRRAVLPG